jgi:hypothetical protein
MSTLSVAGGVPLVALTAMCCVVPAAPVDPSDPPLLVSGIPPAIRPRTFPSCLPPL